MSSALTLLQASGHWLLISSLQASVVAVLVLGVRWVLGSRLTPAWRARLWLLVALRLVLPGVPAASSSLYNLVPDHLREAVPSLSMPSIPGLRALDAGAAGAVSAAAPAPAGARAPTAPAGRATPPVGAPQRLQVAARTASATAAWSWWTWCVLLDALVTALLLGWTLRTVRQWGMVQARAARVVDPRVQTVFAAACAELGVRQPPALRLADGLAGPVLTRWPRACILVPRALPARLTSPQLRCIFLHELAHHRRRDCELGTIASVLGMLHWWNPVLQLALRAWRHDRELACDDVVLTCLRDAERPAYGHLLLDLAAPAPRWTLPPLTAAVLPSPTSLRQRIRHIARRTAVRRSPLWGWLSTAGIAACALTGATSCERATTTAPAPQVRTTTASGGPPATSSPVVVPAGASTAPSASGSGSPHEHAATVVLALTYLAQQQQADGSWGEGRDPSLRQQTTAWVLLDFLGAGYDQTTPNRFRSVVRQGLDYLRRCVPLDAAASHDLPSLGVVACSLSEAYAMTGDAALRAPAQQLVDCLLALQAQLAEPSALLPVTFRPLGDGMPRPNDQYGLVLALSSARAAGLEIRAGMALARLQCETLWHDQNPGWQNLSMQDGQSQVTEPDPAGTPRDASSLLGTSLVFAGHHHDDLMIRTLAQHVLAEGLPSHLDRPFALLDSTFLLFQCGGDLWNRWQAALEPLLTRTQRHDGPDRGSWDPLPAEPLCDLPSSRLHTTMALLLTDEVFARYRLVEREPSSVPHD